MERMRRVLAALVVAMVMIPPGAAHAGRSRFGWLYDTDTLAVREAETEMWVQEQDHRGGDEQPLVWWGPIIGLPNRLEFVLPIELPSTQENGTSIPRLERYGAEVRWRLNNPDPVEAGPFGFLLRFAVKRPVADRNHVRFEIDPVATLDLGSARLDLDPGVIIEASTTEHTAVAAHPALGISVKTVVDLSLGAEFFSEVHFDKSEEVNWAAIGPNLAFVHGRSWISG